MTAGSRRVIPGTGRLIPLRQSNRDRSPVPVGSNHPALDRRVDRAGRWRIRSRPGPAPAPRPPRRARQRGGPGRAQTGPGVHPAATSVASTVEANASPARFVSRIGVVRGNAGTWISPRPPAAERNRTVAPRGPSVTATIGTSSSRAAPAPRSVHSPRLQLRKSTRSTHWLIGSTRSSMFRLLGKQARRQAGPPSASRRSGFGRAAATRTRLGRSAQRARSVQAAWQPRKPIGSLSPCAPLEISSVQSALRAASRVGSCAIPARSSRATIARLVGSPSAPRALIRVPPRLAAKPAPIPPRSSTHATPLTRRGVGCGSARSANRRASAMVPVKAGQPAGGLTRIAAPAGSTRRIESAGSAATQRPSTLRSSGGHPSAGSSKGRSTRSTRSR